MANYLYNGMEFPAPPEWNKEKYPFAVISKDAFNYYFYITGKEINESLTGTIHNGWHCRVPYVKYQKTGNEWVYQSQGDSIGSLGDGVITSKVYWTNTDLYYNDGTLYLAASEPIPVGTAPGLDPLSMWLGWKAGNWVARQRGKVKPATGVYDDTMPIEWKMQDVANNKKIPFETYQIYSYNGLEFGRPDIEADSAYKYHLIEKYSSGYHYWCLKQPFVYINEDKEYAKIEGGYNYSLYICKTGEIGFAHHDDISGDDLKLNWEDIIWTNTNICDADGTVRMAATEPVYIREQVKDWLVKISNYIPSLEIFEKSAVSISYGGEEAILTYVFGDNSYTGCTIVLFMDVTTYTNFVMLAIEKADNEVIPGEPGLYFLTNEPIPGDVTFKFFVPDET